MKEDVWLTNAQLLELLNQGDIGKEKAFAMLYARFQQPILAFVFRRGGGQEAGKDLFQQTMVAFFESYSSGNFKPEMSLEPYIWGIVNNLYRKQRGRDARMPLLLDDLDVNTQSVKPSSFPNEDAIIFRNEIAQLFSKVLGTESQRILLFSFFESYSNDVIASRLGKKESSVKTIKSRAIAKLKDYVAQHPACQRLFYSPFA